MELIQDARNQREVDTALKLVAPLPVVWPTATDCSLALTLFSTLHRSGGLGLIDSLIASLAIGSSARLCTFNDKHYRAVPNLLAGHPYAR
jgi:predicted nucleic acid-binding protein